MKFLAYSFIYAYCIHHIFFLKSLPAENVIFGHKKIRWPENGLRKFNFFCGECYSMNETLGQILTNQLTLSQRGGRLCPRITTG